MSLCVSVSMGSASAFCIVSIGSGGAHAATSGDGISFSSSFDRPSNVLVHESSSYWREGEYNPPVKVNIPVDAFG